MVAFGLASLRGAAVNFKFFADVLKDGLPCWTVVQNWVLRYGLYKLLEPLPKRDDWILILDHTIEFGTKTCFVVLAVSREVFQKRGCRLRHCDVEVAAIRIKHSSTGKDIADTLTQLSAQMGCPAQIVSDAGSNIKSGIKIFKETITQAGSKAEMLVTYDITHKAAILLKHRLKDDDAWKEFTTKMAETKRRVVHTEFVAYAPNKPRDKARWLNLEEKVKWAERILAVKGSRGHPTREEMSQKKKFNEYFGWVHDYRRSITQWRAYLSILSAAKCEVKDNGLGKQTAQRFAKRARKVRPGGALGVQLKADMTAFFEEQTAEFQDSSTWLGTSDIIESVFGKYKLFSARTPLKEVGKTVLTIPVFTSRISLQEVKKAMEAISDKKLRKWLADNLGESLFAKRSKAFALPKQKVR